MVPQVQGAKPRFRSEVSQVRALVYLTRPMANEGESMDSVRVEWNADTDMYVIHVPGQPNIVCTIEDLEEIKQAIEAQLAKAAG